jgi:hypothetical protein
MWAIAANTFEDAIHVPNSLNLGANLHPKQEFDGWNQLTEHSLHRVASLTGKKGRTEFAEYDNGMRQSHWW